MSHEHTPHEIQPVRTGREPSGRGVSRRSFVRLAVGALTEDEPKKESICTFSAYVEIADRYVV